MNTEHGLLRSHQYVESLSWVTKHERRLALLGIESEEAPRLRMAQANVQSLKQRNSTLERQLRTMREGRSKEMRRKFQAADLLIHLVRQYVGRLLTVDDPLVVEILATAKKYDDIK